MKALYLKGPRESGFKDVPEPVANGHDPILKVLACGICGSDVGPWKVGLNPLWAFGGITDSNGPTMGHEFVAIVDDPGDAAERGFKKGDRVTMMPFNFCRTCPSCRNGMEHICWEGWTKMSVGTLKDGAFAEKVEGFAEWLYKVPDNISDEEVCMIEPLAVSIHAVRKGEVKLGDNVLVVGAGPIGMISAAVAKAAGASKVTIAELNVERAKRAVEIGCADAYIDSGAEDAIVKLMTTAGEKGFDCAIECTGSGAGFDTCTMFIAHGGHVVQAGSSSGQVTITPIHLQKNEPIVSGVLGYKVDEYETAYHMVCDEGFDVKRFVTDTVPFDDIQSAFERLADPAGKEIKIVARISEQ